jgi:demethylmenaquinone methyltransferase/2-methoxy-6-polyprenyl-1,4-benzoquinol methylase
MQEPELRRQTDFGFDRVPLAEKQRLVDGVFRRVARRYDLMNDLMSGGLHRVWKDALVSVVRPPRSAKRWALADVAGGTGDIALRVIAAGGPETRATVLDANQEMLAVGRQRAVKRGLDHVVRFVRANAESLPLGDRTQDAVAIAFGIRNVPRIDVALAEAFRVLRTGGQYICLEFSSCDLPGLDALYDLYSFRVIPTIGRLVVGDAEPYRYLVESIRRFPNPEAFAAKMEDAGFRRVSCRIMSGGIVALHRGWRL